MLRAVYTRFNTLPPSLYTLDPEHVQQFMEYLADGNIDLVSVCVSNFLGNEFNEMLTSFCPRLALMCFKE